MPNVTRETTSVLNELQTAWRGVQVAIVRMGHGSDIRPKDVATIFNLELVEAGVKVTAGPIAFRVPEKPSSSSSHLYAVVSGWIVLATKAPQQAKRDTVRFGTQVGYFRENANVLTHVYGTHYDMDEELPGHPVFHAQMCSQVEFAEVISDLFRTTYTCVVDHSQGLLGNVRTPTAQMDVFSVITQIGADHFVSETSAPEVRSAFADLRLACDFFYGAASRLTYLNQPPATHCYRSTHWYERPA